jgi:hypothetical protein
VTGRRLNRGQRLLRRFLGPTMRYRAERHARRCTDLAFLLASTQPERAAEFGRLASRWRVIAQGLAE